MPLESSVLPRLAPRCSEYCPVNSLVPGTPAKIAGETRSDLLAGRLRRERGGGEEQPRRADAALRAALGNEGFLQRMRPLQSLDRLDPRSPCLDERNEAGIDRFAVQQDRAGAAISLATPLLG